MFILDYIREDYVKEQPNGEMKVQYKQSSSGKELSRMLGNIGMTGRDYDVDYDYDKIPEPKKTNPKTGKVINYNEPKIGMRKEPEKRLLQRLMKKKPQIIIPMGSMGCKNFLNVASIAKSRGVPVRQKLEIGSKKEGTYDSFETWIFPMFSMEYYAVNPNIENLISADLGNIKKFMEQGDDAFIPKEVQYELVTTMDRVREIFQMFQEKRPLVSWDLETNSLKAEMAGAKPLVISLSWGEAQGIVIPLEHHEAEWTESQLDEIYQLMRELFASDVPKVGQNIQYDIRFLMGTKDFIHFNNNMDTLIGYWMVVTQDSKNKKTLSNIAYELTDMGGYDEPLEEYKKKYTKDYIERESKKIAEQKEQEKKEIEKEHEQDLKEYNDKVKEYKELGKSTKSLVKPKKRAMSKYPPKSSIKLVNEVDGGNFNYDWIPLSLLYPYAAGDVDCCLRIFYELENKMGNNEKMKGLWQNFYPRETASLAHVEATGVAIDKEQARVLEEEYTKEEERLREQFKKFDEVQQLEKYHMNLYKMGLEEWKKPPKERNKEIAKLRDKYKITDKENKTAFKPSSSTHKGELLFKIMGLSLPYDKESVKDSAFSKNKKEEALTWEDYKTDKGALEYIKENYPEAREITQLLLDYSKVNTLKNNFAVKLPQIASRTKDGRIHGSFRATGTETSRLSSVKPNLQQLSSKIVDPNRFDYNYPIKRMFVSGFENGLLVQADYSSLEMRILGLVAEDEQMTQDFLDGEDMHTNTASMVWGLPPEKVDKDLRKSAKAVNFGLVYGESPFSFASKQGISTDEAEDIFEKYYSTKPKVKQFIDDTHEFVKQNGYVDTLQGHRRIIREAMSKNKKTMNEGLRKSVNTIIQGTGAYLTNMSLVYLDEYIIKKELKSRIVMTVHDSIVVDCPPEEYEEIAKVMKWIMENLPVDFLFIDWNGEKMRYPIKADVEIGENYNDAVDYEPEEVKEFESPQGYIRYENDLGKLEDYYNAEIISEEQYQAALEKVESAKPAYQMI